VYSILSRHLDIFNARSGAREYRLAEDLIHGIRAAVDRRRLADAAAAAPPAGARGGGTSAALFGRLEILVCPWIYINICIYIRSI
jgi:hypothetical protein